MLPEDCVQMDPLPFMEEVERKGKPPENAEFFQATRQAWLGEARGPQAVPTDTASYSTA